MTARLLGKSCCVLSLVDSDRVYWKSVSWSSSPSVSIQEEARYESFCSWVVQDESSRGVTILDSKTDPRCTHIRSKPGLEFYAGVPVLLGGKYKVGALSIQGPASAQISVIDMNILHEMSVWASGELDSILQQKLLDDRETLLEARDNLGLLSLSFKANEKENDPRVLEKVFWQWIIICRLLEQSGMF
jgi:GAF domain-containing protein